MRPHSAARGLSCRCFARLHSSCRKATRSSQPGWPGARPLRASKSCRGQEVGVQRGEGEHWQLPQQPPFPPSQSMQPLLLLLFLTAGRKPGSLVSPVTTSTLLNSIRLDSVAYVASSRERGSTTSLMYCMRYVWWILDTTSCVCARACVCVCVPTTCQREDAGVREEDVCVRLHTMHHRVWWMCHNCVRCHKSISPKNQ
jgi:hypothetical protein